MKLTEKDLDPSIVKKLNELDVVKENFTDADRSGFLSYDGEKFHMKRVNEVSFKKVTDQRELNTFKQHLYVEDETMKNSFISNFNLNNKAHPNLRGQVLNLEGIVIFSTQSNATIRKVKREKNYILVLDTNGIFYKFNRETQLIEFTLNIAEKVKALFAIQKFLPYDILDFEIFRGGFLFSTTNNGVFFADVSNNNLEVVFPENDIMFIRDVGNENILLISGSGISTIYNFERQIKVEGLSHLKKAEQVAKSVVVQDGDVFILGKHRYNTSTQGLLHIMKRDRAGISFENVTNSVYPGYDSHRHQVMFVTKDENFVYLAGIKDSKHIFLWAYDLENLHEEFDEFVFDKFEVDKLDYLKVVDRKIFFNANNRLIVIDFDKNVRGNLQLQNTKPVTDILFENDYKDIIVVSGDNLTTYSFPEYNYEETFTAQIVDGESCNNIEIFIKSNTGKESIMILSGEELSQISPTNYIVTESNSYIRLLGNNSKSIVLKLTVPQDTIIEGIVVSLNRIFLK